MRVLGNAIRYLLNINTIWGLMILVSLALCAANHYLPTRTVIPGEALRAGANTLTLRIAGAGGKTADFTYVLTRTAAGLELPADAVKRGGLFGASGAAGESSAPGASRASGPSSGSSASGGARKPTAGEGWERPYLISARAVGSGFVLKWDYDGAGKYEAAINGVLIARGSLVTFQGLTNVAFDRAQAAFKLALELIASMVLFLGLMKVGEDAGIVQFAARALHPVTRLIFPGIPKDHPAGGAVLMNITTGVLGLGNAATPFGIKAMKELQSLNRNPDVATDSQIMLLAWNTGGLALIPTMLLAARKSAGCTNPFEIIGTCLLAGLCATTVAVITAKLLGRLPIFSVRAALGEEGGEAVPVGAGAGADAEEGRP